MYYFFIVSMKMSFDLNSTLYSSIEKSAKTNGRSVSGEIRFQLNKLYTPNGGKN